MTEFGRGGRRKKLALDRKPTYSNSQQVTTEAVLCIVYFVEWCASRTSSVATCVASLASYRLREGYGPMPCAGDRSLHKPAADFCRVSDLGLTNVLANLSLENSVCLLFICLIQSQSDTRYFHVFVPHKVNKCVRTGPFGNRLSFPLNVCSHRHSLEYNSLM
ncbi:hypothetical protein MPTK1_6g13830 [Marchantia polymorpha subsp. ruderalis]|uniref:Uncharacterized protein n=2 Tax=Marchantia polymorpha TaxID=3197 RepID=A0AAF6BRS9_MARPO|nr:hypothetical protein MARPO_0047s0035 [Marchantia polymorpha]BBN14713.1 hypothetical protein Mp_6g13830 [Marchantia polymorpha subsp. ruderalis]|eukprot:PTQ39052.1 hypothetical protein MARPO_0047s0035 [Marchantia polymorpha]